ncbi:MAG TPA: hypothetical protein PLY87_26350 [Planctomycetaceae bacterium]|nr:hypothetical protein [Planctomycetaceae bacterium]HQZ68647.1 hypothetical protein [Planctomycetaceae bacterium]
MKKLMIITGSCFMSLVLLVSFSSRSLKELFGYAKATADTTVNQLEEKVPNAIRDQKLQNDIDQARGDIIDRRVKLNLAATEIRKMQDEIEQLSGAVSRRETILAEAYPALETAAKDRLTEVTFAGTKWLPTELGSEIDRLLMQQDRDERQLSIRREALVRLEKSVEDGSSAITQMESKLVEAENEFQVLVVRRDQAENENELLDLVAAAGRKGNTATAQIGTNLSGIRTNVEELEARNEARRDTVPAGNGEKSRLTQAYDRLERLKSLHEKLHAETSVEPTTAPAGVTTAVPNSTVAAKSESGASASKDVIIVIKDSTVEPNKSEE